jgi:hypothetical protein
LWSLSYTTLTDQHVTSKTALSGLFCSYSKPDFCEAVTVTEALFKHLRDRIAEARHDIEAIETQIASENGSSTPPEHTQRLRGLQEMYRQRIAKMDEEIVSVSAR